MASLRWCTGSCLGGNGRLETGGPVFTYQMPCCAQYLMVGGVLRICARKKYFLKMCSLLLASAVSDTRRFPLASNLNREP